MDNFYLCFLLLCAFSVFSVVDSSAFRIPGKTLALTETTAAIIAAVLARYSKGPGVVTMGAR
jgi:hypothetical protein